MRKKIGFQVLLVLVLMLLAGLTGGCQGSKHNTHTYGVWEVTKKPTCTESGERVQKCSCGKTKKEEIAPTGHKEVKDKAKEATCTKDGLTEGSHCANCGEVFEEQKVIPAAHEEVKLRAIAATCTRAGKKEGSRCSVCDEIVVRQKKIRAKGHQFVDGVCVSCKKTQPDTAAAILIDQLNEEKTANFITKKAYKGGSTISFQAYVPNGVTWWAVSWTKSASQIGLYDWAEGHGTQMFVKTGSWQQCSVTLPNDNDSYYIYFVGAKGEWKGEELLIDDVKITDASGKVIGTDNFNDGVEGGLFSIVKTNPTNGNAVVYGKEICGEHKSVSDKAVAATCETPGKTAGSHCDLCGKILELQTIVPATGHKWSNGYCSVCKQKREDLVAAIAIDQLNENAPMNFITKQAYPSGSKVSFKVYVPEGVTWSAISWTTNPSDVSLYKWTEGFGQEITVKSDTWTTCSITLPKDGKDYYVYFVGAKGEWGGRELLINDFVITNAKGEVIAEDSFDNGVENGLFDVVEVNPTTGMTTIYSRTKVSPCDKNGHKVVVDKAVAATCTEPGKTAGSHCSVCKKVLKEQQEIPAKGHSFNKNGVCHCGEKLLNRAVAIAIDQINESGDMSFITRRAYGGGSTITMKAYVPEGTGWWAISWTTDPADTDIYKWTEGFGEAQPSTTKVWKEYSVTLPDDGENYYIYVVGAKGEWNGKELLIDDVEITNKLGEVVAKDDFNSGIQSGLFKVITHNPTNQSVVGREIIVGEVCPHSVLLQEAGKDATCTESGILGRTYCKKCGETIHEATEIKPTGHKWSGEVCDICGQTRENLVAAIVVDKLNDSAPMNFITKETYPGGSVVSFKAYVPYGVTWWAISWTTDPANADLYKWATDGLGQAPNSSVGEWKDYSVTLPDDGQNYYIYIVAEKGQWNGQELLLDEFVISDKDGNPIANDKFDDGILNGIFNIVAKNPSNDDVIVYEKVLTDPCKNGHTAVVDAAVAPTCTEVGYTEGSHCSVCQFVIQAQEEIPATGHTYDANGKCTCGAIMQDRAVAINVDRLTESGNMNFITRDAYAGGSKVTLRAYVPEGVAWWAINWTTDPSDADLYKWNSHGLGATQPSTANVWKEYSVTLPDDGQSYYVYIVGAKGEWSDKELLVDDVTIDDKNGALIAEDGFNNGIQSGLFKIVEKDSSEVVVVREVVIGDMCQHTELEQDPNKEATCTEPGLLGRSYCKNCGKAIHEATVIQPNGHTWENNKCTVCGEKQENKVVALHMKYIREDGKSLVTKNAYPGGSKITFKALAPVTGQWWGLGYVAEGSSTDIYSIVGKNLNDDAKVGTWNEYTVTLPDDGQNYYIFFGGGKDDPWINNPLLIDDFVITDAAGTNVLASDNFNEGFADDVFAVIDKDGSQTVVELKAIVEKQTNTVAALHMKYIREDGASLKSKQAYPGGSTVTFKAMAPVTGQWWGLGYVAEGSSTDIYSIASGKDLNDDAKVGTWNEYSVTLPDDGQNYYIFFGGGKDNPWINNPLLIDDVVVKNASGTPIAEDDFEAGLSEGIFNAITMDGSNTVVETKVLEAEEPKEPNTVVAIHMKYIREDGTSLKSKQAYPGGSTVTFKAMAPITGQWWGLGYVAEGSSTDIYSIASGKDLNDDAKVGTWNEYSVTLPDDGQNYYIFFGGGKDNPWINNPLLIDDVVVKNASGTPIAEDDFEAGLTAGIFNAIEMDGGNTVIATITE